MREKFRLERRDRSSLNQGSRHSCHEALRNVAKFLVKSSVGSVEACRGADVSVWRFASQDPP